MEKEVRNRLEQMEHASGIARLCGRWYSYICKLEKFLEAEFALGSLEVGSVSK